MELLDLILSTCAQYIEDVPFLTNVAERFHRLPDKKLQNIFSVVRNTRFVIGIISWDIRNVGQCSLRRLKKLSTKFGMV